MMTSRRRALAVLSTLLAARPAGATLSPRALAFPADHAAHPDARTEWWYVTGWLARGAASEPDFGFQLTFFRSRTGLAASSPSRFAARQLVFAHAALTDLGRTGAPARLVHDQRSARAGFGLAEVPDPSSATQRVVLRDWSLERRAPSSDGGARLSLGVKTEAFALTLDLAGDGPPLLQGAAGWSRKGPRPDEASEYVTEPQLAATGRLGRAGAGPALEVRGRAWLDHEWSDELMPADAVGWDWLGLNLLDGSALTVFQLRRSDGVAAWAGGSFRAPGSPSVRAFGADEVRLVPGRSWRSAATGADYPVEWRVTTPAGTWTVRALLDDQELDSRASTGSVYWEGLAELRDAAGRRVGLGYLEMTGRAGKLRL